MKERGSFLQERRDLPVLKPHLFLKRMVRSPGKGRGLREECLKAEKHDKTGLYPYIRVRGRDKSPISFSFSKRGNPRDKSKIE
jgi:hypothetical protein